MTMTTYTVPANPADAESAALELVVRLPALVLVLVLVAEHFTLPLRDYCGALRVEGAFAGLSWPDAKQVAAIVADVMHRDDPAAALRNRARNVLAGADRLPWCDRGGAVRALNIAAAVLDHWP